MAKATTKAAKVPTIVSMETPVELQQVFKVTEGMKEDEVSRADALPGVRIEFDFVHFQKFTDAFIGTLKVANQRAYLEAEQEFASRSRRVNTALHEIGVDPISKILDRPRGKSNPLVRDGEMVQKLLGAKWYVTWKVAGGEGDFESSLEMGFKPIRRPVDKNEQKTKAPFEWTGELWKIRDGTVDPTSGDEIFNVMVVVERQRWDDSLKAMSMASHNQYSQHKQQFIEGAENISRDMLGGKEHVTIQDMDDVVAEKFSPGILKSSRS